MLLASCSSRSDDGNGQYLAQLGQGIIGVTVFYSIMVHTCEQYFSCSAFIGFPSPFKKIPVRFFPAAVQVTFPPVCCLLGVDCYYAYLRAKVRGYVIYQLWTFVSPGLYAGEKRHARGAFLAGNIMFFIGIGVGYFLVFPLTLRFLAEYQVSEMVPNQISLDSYMSNFLTLNFIMGLVFELPLLCWLLSNMGLITRRFFKTYRRHAIVILLILAAFITPSSDPFTLSVVFVPLYALYELSAWVVKPASQKDDGNSEEDSNEILDEH